MPDPSAAYDAPADAQNYRRVIGQFATGVTVIVAQEGEDTHGMTANSVTSLSLEPLLLLFNVDRRAHLFPIVRDTGVFTVNILRVEQEPLSRYFAGGARKGMARPDFRFVPWVGAPRLDGCLASVACTVAHILDGGDHWIVIGRVVALHQGEMPGSPLLFYAGQYRQLAQAIVRPPADGNADAAPIPMYYDPWYDDTRR
ncbi:MAG: flavin reductase family protein [Anaerolineae bacterium]